MADTPHLSLPLLDGGQAQKHVTVNEALTRLDALVQISALSRSVSDPPTSPVEGDRYIVAAGATGDWSGRDGAVALAMNGGWDLIDPSPGWRAFVVDDGAVVSFDGVDWRSGVMATSTVGARTTAEVLWFDHVLSAGASSDTATAIPDRGIVLGVTSRVISAITGPTSWRLGIAGAEDRYGSGIGVGLNSEVHSPTTAPVAYFGATPLRLSADGGAFAGGTVRLAIHLLRLETPPLV